MTDKHVYGVSDRLGRLTESAPQAIDALAKRYRAEGRPIIAFGAGEPDFDTPANIVTAAQAALSDPRNHHYSPPAGLPTLREAVAASVSNYTGCPVESREVAIANGGKQAIFNALSAILNPGDEVLLPAPYWTSYPEQIGLAGGVAVPVATSAESEFKATRLELESARTPRTKLLILTSPSNPTGSVYSADELAELAEWAVETGIWVMTDEIYRHFVYDDVQFASIAPFVPREQLVIVGGLAKSHVLTGWRLGWTVAPAHLIKAITSFQSHTTGNVSNVAQHAALAALQDGDDFPKRMRDVFDRRRRIAYEVLSKTPGVKLPRPKGAFYLFADVTDAMSAMGIATSVDLASRLLEDIDVAVVPGEAFGAPGFLRFSYALDDAQLVEGLERIRALFTERLS